MRTYTVGEIAKIVGLPTKTIRFYEEEGVITAPNRRENGYRSYSESNVEELKLLKYARDLGLPLSETKKLMKGCENGDCEHSQEYIEQLIDAYTDKLQTRITEMNTLKIKLGELKKTVQHCEGRQTLCCNILTQLAEGGEKI